MINLDVSSILYYGRSYNDREVNYYVNLEDLKVYSTESLIQDFDFTDEILSDDELMIATYRFAPIFRVDIVAEMRRFLNDLNNRRISEKIEELDSEQLYIYFQSYVELNSGDHQRWREHEKRCLTKAAVDWCKQHHVPYVL
ncbi:MAG: hypothetical protein E7478_02335 [Ruminococcaceae bacterium]|nr:hypothetical protein [Oscillospiraceae bacterium]